MVGHRVKDGAGPYMLMRHERRCESGFTFRAVELIDIEQIRQWRNAQMTVLRQSHEISPAEQAQYFSTHVWPEKPKQQPSQVLLAIERGGALVGYGGLVHISWPDRRAEVSFLLDPVLEQCLDERSAVFRAFLTIVQPMAFEEFGLHRLFTETYAHREDHIATLEASGFQYEGRLRQHVVVGGSPMDALVHGCLAARCSEWK